MEATGCVLAAGLGIYFTCVNYYRAELARKKQMEDAVRFNKKKEQAEDETMRSVPKKGSPVSQSSSDEDPMPSWREAIKELRRVEKNRKRKKTTKKKKKTKTRQPKRRRRVRTYV